MSRTSMHLFLAAFFFVFLGPACNGDSGGGSGRKDAGDHPLPDVGQDAAAGKDAGLPDAEQPPADEGPHPTKDDAEVVSADFPASMSCFSGVEAFVVMRNTGTATWSREAGYKLGAVDDSDPFYKADNRVWLAEGDYVSPGQTAIFTFTLNAPPEAGRYTSDWQMVHEGVMWFGQKVVKEVEVRCGGPLKRTGLVRLSGNSLIDNHGEFNALGATMMWAAWGYKFDRERLERNLRFLSQNGFEYFRCLGVVGDYENEDYWDGREIDWRWPDYAEVTAGLTDLAHDVYGLRVEWTLIGDGQINIPDEADRYALVDTFIEMSRGREEKIIHFEIANEAWQNGFEGDDGLAQLRALSAYMKERTDILVAASAPSDSECPGVEELYNGGIADIATIHFDRNVSLVDGHWRPVRQPWGLADCNDVPVGSNNEPIGPGASVASENDPIKLVSAAIVTYVANIPLYVFHSSAGVRGDTDLSEMAGAASFVHLKEFIPAALASWSRKNAHWEDSPFQAFAKDANGNLVPDRMWPDLDNPTGGAVRVYGGVSGREFFVIPFGILNSVTLAPRRAADFDVIDPLTGAVVRSLSLPAGEQFSLSGGETFVLKGSYR